ncbi:MAG: TetR/AcrR family transcriptional regulator [Monoglobaceae bacterium]
MRSATYQVNEEEILDKIFSFIVKHGLENITIREMCKGTGIALGSIYYWFNGKDELIAEVTEYGLKKVVGDIFDYVYKNADNPEVLFKNCLSEIRKYKDDLRFIYQMAASPVYGGKVREHGRECDYVYDKCADKLAETFGCGADELKPMVYLFISAVLDYIIWDDEEKSKLQLDFIYNSLKKKINK